MSSKREKSNHIERYNHLDENNNVAAVTLYNLNNDCLVELCQFLNIIDLYRLRKVSQRFNDIIVNNIMKNREINLEKIKEFCSVRKVLKIFGSTLSGLVASESDVQYRSARCTNSEQLFHILNKNCHNIRHLNIAVKINEISTDSCDQFSNKLTNLKSIRIENVNGSIRRSIGYSNFAERLLQHTKGIEKLEMKNFAPNISSVRRFSNIHTFVLDSCTIKLEQFTEIMKNLGNKLKHFEWNDSCWFLGVGNSLIGKVIEIIDEYNLNLITLKISDTAHSRAYQEFGKIKNLKNLENFIINKMHFYPEDKTFLLQFKNVPKLTLGAKYAVNDENTIELLSHFTNLRSLKLITLGSSSSGDTLGYIGIHCIRLEKFYLERFNLTQVKLINFIKNSPIIRLVDLSKSTIVFSSNLYYQILPIIDSREPKLPLLFRISQNSARNLLRYEKSVVNIV